MSLLAELRRRNVVRVGIAYVIVAWTLVQVGESVFPAFDVPDGVLRGFVILLALGLPAVLVFAWVFELTPEGIRLEKDIDRSASISAVTGRKLDRLIIAALAVAVVVLLYQLNTRPTTPPDRSIPAAAAGDVTKPAAAVGEAVIPGGEPSVAVLPFVNMSDDPANEYFSDGISEELLNVLVKVSGIKVASRTSSFSFKGKDVSIPEIAEQLKVDHVLEGSVRKSGNKVRVTAQLIDVASDRHLWSETYDRELADIFAIQDEISSHIVQALQIALGAGEQQAMTEAGKPTGNLEAYEYYLQARYFWQRRGEDNIRKAIGLFEQAIELDPSFARAWSGLAAARITLPTYAGTPWEESFAEARRAAEQALALDDSQADAYAGLGDIMRSEGDWRGAERNYLAAIEHEPNNATGHLWYAEFLHVTGRIEDAARHNEIAYGLDPLSPGANVNLAGIRLAQGRDQEAARLARAALELGHFWGAVQLGFVHLRRREFDEAIARFSLDDEAFAPTMTVFVTVAEALRARDAAPAIETLSSMSPEQEIWPTGMFIGLLLLGATEQAFALFDARFAEIGGNDFMYLWGREAAPLRADPRFIGLVERLGLVEYWHESGSWPDLCRPDGDGVTCRP